MGAIPQSRPDRPGCCEMFGLSRVRESVENVLALSARNSKQNRRAVACPPVCVIWIFESRLLRFGIVLLFDRFVSGVEGVLQRDEVFAGTQCVEHGLLGFELLL